MKIKKSKTNKIKNQLKRNHFLSRMFNMLKSKRKEKKSFISKIKKKSFIIKRFYNNDVALERFKRAKRNY